ncbi:hypothetical protein P0136_11960 [Lentisphaerota bacterium ZTH]|nr:hypothetical protein JYG24_10530 [Lentisphaerota bacterium]WET06072.1 hypothetical protein P0136_11960 [Lentisphaerota bacterium ZTH]
MDVYIVNKIAQETGEHEIHKTSCNFLPGVEERTPIGIFETCHEAIGKAKEFYDNVDGCKYCCPECHNR